MGFMEPHPTAAIAERILNSSDYIALATLGSASDGPVTVQGVADALTAMTAQLWAPIFDLIFDSISELLLRGDVARRPGTEILEITPAGRSTLTHLLSRRIAAPLTPFGQVGVRLKLAFLHHLPENQRRRQIETLIAAYECEVSGRCRAWTHNGPLGRQWLDLQMDGLEDGISLLRRLAVANPA